MMSRCLSMVLCSTLAASAAVLPVRASDFATLDAVDCVIYPSQEANIGSSTAGVLESLLVDRSDFVNAGDPIAQLESDAEQAAVELATARSLAAAELNFRRVSAEHSKRQFTRVEQLHKQKTVSAKEFDDRKTEAQLGEYQLRKAEENKDILDLELARAQVLLDQRTIRSPFSGVVVERYKSTGEYVDSDPIVRIVQLHPLHIETIISAAYVDNIRPGMYADVVSASHPDKRWTARVDRVDRVVDVASGTFGVRLSLPNPDYTITAGERCQLSFVDNEVAAVHNKPATGMTIGLYSSDEHDKPDNDKPTLDPVDVQAVELDEPALHVPSLAAASKSIDAEPGANDKVVDGGQRVTPINTATCINEGPFFDRSIAEQQASQFSQQGGSVKLVTKSVNDLLGHLVMSPVFQTREEAKAYFSSLEAVGVKDALLPRKAAPVRVSIGAFSQYKKATSMVSRLADKAVDAEILPWVKTRQEYYLVGSNGENPTSTACESPVIGQ